MEPVQVTVCTDLADDSYDVIVVVTDNVDKLNGKLESLKAPIENYASFHKNYDDVDEVFLIVTDAVPSKRLIYAPTGPVNGDYDDVRRFEEAANKGIKKALKCGCKCPLLVCPDNSAYPEAELVAVLGALRTFYVPIEVYEGVPAKRSKAEKLGLFIIAEEEKLTADVAQAIESGRIVTRDIGGSDPERMAAPRVEEYVRKTFDGSVVQVTVESDRGAMEKQYPLLAAVDRASRFVDRHKARVIYLDYKGTGQIEKTLFLVGKGVTYDTGGADIKAGGHMAGMHRDKCGAAAVAGFFKILSILKPATISVRGVMGMVRNSVGSECYVADEIITSRAGVRVRVGNTDAEGRLVMADLLCKLKEEASDPKIINPHLFTIATLTGHAVRTVGLNYSVIMDNGPARKANMARDIQTFGHKLADPLEISTIRREDFETHKGKTEYDDALSCQTGVSGAGISRGHQSPAAFMMMVAGLDKHGLDSDAPLAYTHIDIAGSSGDYPGIPTAAPIVALAGNFILN